MTIKSRKLFVKVLKKETPLPTEVNSGVRHSIIIVRLVYTIGKEFIPTAQSISLFAIHVFFFIDRKATST